MKKLFLFTLLILASKASCAPSNLRHLENRIPKENARHQTFLKAMELMLERNVKTIVETGTSRYGGVHCIGDGCSTLIFSDWAKENNATLYSVDIDRNALLHAKAALKPPIEHVHFVHKDSVEFLKNFNRPIDFLYLDSYDFELDNPNPSQQHHLNEIKAAMPWLTENSIILIDDCDLPYGGKGKLVIEFLEDRGWKVLLEGYQVILVYN